MSIKMFIIYNNITFAVRIEFEFRNILRQFCPFTVETCFYFLTNKITYLKYINKVRENSRETRGE